MSDTPANGQTQETPPPQAVSLVINAQYLRDFSFENPRAPESLTQMQKGPPEVSIEIDVNARALNPEMFEVILSIKAEAKSGDDIAFLTEIDYAGLVTIRGANQDLLAALVLIEAPRLLFPFARAIISDATREGGFPPLMINPVDFAEIQRRKAAAQAQAQPVANA